MQTLHRLGYEQELQRSMGAFSNYALSLSVVCIPAGGVTSFHVGLCSVGGAPSAWAGRSSPPTSSRPATVASASSTLGDTAAESGRTEASAKATFVTPPCRLVNCLPLPR
jgi:hypothetical protein